MGTSLREAREHLGLSVADVANQIKFAPRQIEALEADDLQHLPEAAFLRGFIRSYAKILQLDAQKLLAALPQSKTISSELAPASVNVPFPDAHSLPRQNLVLLVAAALLAVIAGAFALWNFKSPLKQAKVVQIETPVSLPAEVQIIQAPIAPGVRVAPSQAQSPVPVAKTPVIEQKIQPAKPVPKSVAATQAQPNKTESKPEAKPVMMLGLNPEAKPKANPATPPQAQNVISAAQSELSSEVIQLRLEFDKESWTEIKDRDGKIISSQVNLPGSVLNVKGHPPFTMLIGHGLSARLFREGKQVDMARYINKYSEVAHVTLK
ncbi:MAG: RodZ domain-containing protein [Gallionella sp.]